MTGPRRARLSTALVVAAALGAACRDGGPATREKRSDPLAENVVARVEGTDITLADVEELAERGSLTASEALARLEAEALLSAEAERRGYADAPAVGDVAEQARVQALLAGDIDSIEPTPAEIDAAYAAQRDRFHTPELRAATHVFALLQKDATPEQERAGRTFALEAVQQLRAAADPITAIDEYNRASPETVRVGLDVKVETLPLVAKAGPFVSEFSDAMFALPKAGAVSDPVRTQFGWHVIVLREIVPERLVPEAEAREELRKELAVQKRQQRFDAFLRSLQSRTRVTYGSDVKSALATLEF